jgi:hypothetical protein
MRDINGNKIEEFSLEECIKQEILTIKVLKREKAACKGCQIQAIKYHEAVLVYLQELERRFLNEESGN